MEKVIIFFAKLLEHLSEWLYSLIKQPVEPPPAFYPPTYLAEIQKAHSGLPVEELSETYDAEALEDTAFYTPHIDREGDMVRNEKGNLILDKYKGELIGQGKVVELYRYAFMADGGSYRETRWHVTDKKGLVDIRKFSKPE